MASSLAIKRRPNLSIPPYHVPPPSFRFSMSVGDIDTGRLLTTLLYSILTSHLSSAVRTVQRNSQTSHVCVVTVHRAWYSMPDALGNLPTRPMFSAARPYAGRLDRAGGKQQGWG